jgi:peptidoglycan glycosyltransferase
MAARLVRQPRRAERQVAPNGRRAPQAEGAAPRTDRWRGRERALLLWTLPLVLLAAWGLAYALPGPAHARDVFLDAVTVLGTVWLACAGLHVLLGVQRFDGDQLFLPILSLLLLIGTAYHLDIRGPATAGLTPKAYLTGALLCLGVLAFVTLAGPWFRRLSLLFEEKVWWRFAGDRPYYESIPFHLFLIALMAVLVILLLFRGIRSQEGSLIQVPLPGGFRFTPSELIRLAVAFFLADFLGRNSRVMRNLRQPLASFWPLNRIRLERKAELVILLATVLLYCLFFYAFKDFGPAAVIIVLMLTVLYAATGRALTPLVMGGAVAAAIVLAVKTGAVRTLGNRVEMWLSPWDTHFLNGDHLARILWAISTGGWFGLGPGTHNLPVQVPLAMNDAAFAGIAASMGMWTGLAVLGLYAALTWRGMLAARRAPTDRTRLLAFSLTALLAFQAVWICGAMVQVFPFTGINLPFVSTGLTSMIASAIALGTVWNISRTPAGTDSSDATPEVLRGVTRMARPVVAGFALPAVGLLLYGCPWLLGDRTMMRSARGVGRKREITYFANPYIEKFRQRFPRGRVFSADNRLLAASNPGPEELDAIRQLSPELARKVERQERQNPSGERYYPLGASAAQLIGWTPQGRFAAKAGSVETSWDALLRGYRPDQLPFYFRTRNNPLVRPPQPQDLQLTIDAELQRFAARRLSRAVESWGGAGGAAVVFDVSTGAVLAAVTSPTFDPNGLTLERMEQYIAQNRRTQVLTNKALAKDALYFPGSSFKILTAAAGLEAEVDGTVTCNGGNAEPLTWEYAGRRYRRPPGKISDYGDHGHGTMSLSGGMDYAFAASCNVFFGTVAVKAGPDRLREVMRAAELSQVPPAKQLAEHLPYDGFGQIDVKTSPLEMAMVASAAAVAAPDAPVDAYPTRPNWVQAIVTKDRRREPPRMFGGPNPERYQPFRQVIAGRLRKMMIDVVESPTGTAHGAFYPEGAQALPGITVGGKTGTAEFEKPARRGGTTLGRHAWFVGFARSDHEVQPRTLAFAVLVEDVRKGGTGGQVCAPVARDLIGRILPPPGQESHPIDGTAGLENFYRQQVRPRLGPLGPAVDWFRGLLRQH